MEFIDNLVKGNKREIARYKRIIGALEEANKILVSGKILENAELR